MEVDLLPQPVLHACRVVEQVDGIPLEADLLHLYRDQ